MTGVHARRLGFLRLHGFLLGHSLLVLPLDHKVDRDIREGKIVSDRLFDVPEVRRVEKRFAIAKKDERWRIRARLGCEVDSRILAPPHRGRIPSEGILDDPVEFGSGDSMGGLLVEVP